MKHCLILYTVVVISQDHVYIYFAYKHDLESVNVVEHSDRNGVNALVKEPLSFLQLSLHSYA